MLRDAMKDREGLESTTPVGHVQAQPTVDGRSLGFVVTLALIMMQGLVSSRSYRVQRKFKHPVFL